MEQESYVYRFALMCYLPKRNLYSIGKLFHTPGAFETTCHKMHWDKQTCLELLYELSCTTGSDLHGNDLQVRTQAYPWTESPAYNRRDPSNNRRPIRRIGSPLQNHYGIYMSVSSFSFRFTIESIDSFLNDAQIGSFHHVIQI